MTPERGLQRSSGRPTDKAVPGFGSGLRWWRQRRGFSQLDLAGAADTPLPERTTIPFEGIDRLRRRVDDAARWESDMNVISRSLPDGRDPSGPRI
jgi:hypothetical protein